MLNAILSDFFARALLAGIGVALVAGPLGCFIVWRRLAYFGDTLAHGGLLGVALALLFDMPVALGIFLVSALVAILLMSLRRQALLSSDALLGLLSHSTLAIGLVCLAFMSWVRVDLLGFLFGDILAVSRNDLMVIYGGGAVVLLILSWIWHAMFAATVNTDIAAAEGLHPQYMHMIFMLLMAGVVAMAIKIVGVLLMTALLIIPAATARRLATGPEQMAILASICGILAVVSGLFGSLWWDTPSGPSIVVAALVLFMVSALPIMKFNKIKHGKDSL